MSELEDRLNSILGDPQAMGQIMALAQSLGGKGAGQAPPPPSGESAQQAQAPTEPSQAPDLSALLGTLTGGGEGGMDPRLLTMLSRVMQSYQADDDGKAALLLALRPYVQEKRYARLDKAIQIAKLSRLVRVALDVFRGNTD